VFAVNYNLRFYPAVLQMRAAVQRGDLGTIFHVNGSYMQDWLLKDTDYNWRLLPNEGGALRAVSDIGTHWMDAASFILGAKISEVYAQLETLHKTRKRPLGESPDLLQGWAEMKYATYPVETEDYAAVLLRWGSGAFGSVNVSQVAAGPEELPAPGDLRLEEVGLLELRGTEHDPLRQPGRGQRGIAARVPGFMEDVAGFTDYPAGTPKDFPMPSR
jgi:predicted dehydrogenase